MFQRGAAYLNPYHEAMTDFLGRLCPGEDVKVSVYSSRSGDDIERWGAKHMWFEWDLGSFEHIARILQSDHKYETQVLIAYGDVAELKYKRSSSQGWVSRALPRDMR